MLLNVLSKITPYPFNDSFKRCLLSEKLELVRKEVIEVLEVKGVKEARNLLNEKGYEISKFVSRFWLDEDIRAWEEVDLIVEQLRMLIEEDLNLDSRISLKIEEKNVKGSIKRK